MNAYCLFCNTQKRKELAGQLRQRYGLRVIAPKIIQRKWIKGKPTEVVHDYLPGYLFLYSEQDIMPLPGLSRIDEVYRVLGERDNGNRLTGADLAFAEMLRGCDGVIGVMKTYREGDRVKLAEGAMRGVDGEIVKLDRRGRALVRFSFDGSAIQSWVAIDMMEGNGLEPLAPGATRPEA